MIHRIIENPHGHLLKNQKILLFNEIVCTACSQGKFVVRLSLSKVGYEFTLFLQRVQRDICGSIHLPSELFRYFIVLIDAFVEWLYIYLLSTCNITFVRLLAHYKIKGTIPRLSNQNHTSR